MDQEILALAMVLGNVSESDRQRLEVLCQNARRELEGQLRGGVTAQDCGDTLILAAAWLALADLRTGDAAAGVTAFSAGNLSIQTGEGASGDVLRGRARRLMAPYLLDGGFCFRGMRG